MQENFDERPKPISMIEMTILRRQGLIQDEKPQEQVKKAVSDSKFTLFKPTTDEIDNEDLYNDLFNIE